MEYLKVNRKYFGMDQGKLSGMPIHNLNWLYIDFSNDSSKSYFSSQSFKIAFRTYKRLCTIYVYNFALVLPNSTLSRSISPLEDFNELFKDRVLSGHFSSTQDILFKTLFIAKYIQKDFQRIFKIVLKI